MGAKKSKVNASPAPGGAGVRTTGAEAGAFALPPGASPGVKEEFSEQNQGSARWQGGEKGKDQKRKRKKTLHPMRYTDQEVVGAIEAIRSSQLDLRNKLKENRISLRSNASISDASWYTDNSSIELIQHADFEYPFENVVFEGGGNKGLAYAGAVREMERIGLWKNVRRLAGTSAGAMWACLLALGYNSYEIEDFLGLNLSTFFLDARCGKCSLLPNILKNFGWHPAWRLFEWFGDRVEEMTGDPDTTFKQLYEMTGKELCLVVTNLTLMDAEYCHVKTTPNMPIRMAVRMSLAIPGLFGAVRSKTVNGVNYYVDGGLLGNYPIYCFDGWWLSMKPEDSMLRRLQPLEDIGRLWDKKERFGTFNPKTIGLVLYSSDEQDMMVSKLEKRGVSKPNRPNTKLSRKRKEMKQIRNLALREHAIVSGAMSGFLRLLSEYDIDETGTISREELEKAFSVEVDYFQESQKRKLFGDNYTVEEIFKLLDHEKTDEITFRELQTFAEKRGVDIQSNFLGFRRRDIKSFSSFLSALSETLLVNVKRIFVTDDDTNRTIGIDTVYIDTTDFELEEGDKRFLFEQGERAVRSFLRHYVRLNDPPLKKELRDGSVTETTFRFEDKRNSASKSEHGIDERVPAKENGKEYGGPNAPMNRERLTRANVELHERISDRPPLTAGFGKHLEGNENSDRPPSTIVIPRILPPISRPLPPDNRDSAD